MLLTSKRCCFGGYKNSKPLLLHLNFGEEAATPSTHPDTHANSHRRSPRPIHRLPARSAASAQNPLQPSPPFFFHRVVSVSTIPQFFFPCRSPYCKAPSRWSKRPLIPPLSSSLIDPPAAKPPPNC